MIKVSIIVPVYNVEKYLNKCLESIINQTLKDIEIILVDDGSADNSNLICAEYALKDNRITVVHKSNGGSSEARNAGLCIAQGEYIGFVDSDDWIEKEMFESLYSAAKENNADIISFDPKNKDDRIIEKDVLKYYFLKGDVSVCTKIFNKKLFNNFNFLSGRTSEDVIASYELIKRCSKYVEIPGDFYHIRLHQTSTTRSQFKSSDLTAVEFTELVAQDVKNYSPDNYKYAILHNYKAMFNIINKTVIYGFKSYDDRKIYQDNYKSYRKCLKRNRFDIFKSKYFSNNDKLQIFIFCISVNLFIITKKIYLILANSK